MLEYRIVVLRAQAENGEIVRARTWFGQFPELVLKCAVRNVELALDASTG